MDHPGRSRARSAPAQLVPALWLAAAMSLGAACGASLDASAPGPGAHAEPGSATQSGTVSDTEPSQSASTGGTVESLDPSSNPELPAESELGPPDGSVESLLHATFGGSVARVAQVNDELFVLAVEGGPADQHRDVVSYPPSAAEAAGSARVVAIASIWRVEPERLTRVLARPVKLQSMACDFDDCAIVELPFELHEGGRFEIGSGGCAETLAKHASHRSGNASIDAFDRAVLPAICRGAGSYTWDGQRYALGAGSGAGSEAALPLDAAAAQTALLARMFDGLGARELREVWSAEAGTPSFARFLRRAAGDADPSSVAGSAQVRADSGPGFELTEVWALRRGSRRRVFWKATGLAPHAGTSAPVRLEVSQTEGELLVEDPSGHCAAQPSRGNGPVAAPETDAVAILCAGLGRYRWNGAAFVWRK